MWPHRCMRGPNVVELLKVDLTWLDGKKNWQQKATYSYGKSFHKNTYCKKAERKWLFCAERKKNRERIWKFSSMLPATPTIQNSLSTWLYYYVMSRLCSLALINKKKTDLLSCKHIIHIIVFFASCDAAVDLSFLNLWKWSTDRPTWRAIILQNQSLPPFTAKNLNIFFYLLEEKKGSSQKTLLLLLYYKHETIFMKKYSLQGKKSIKNDDLKWRMGKEGFTQVNSISASRHITSGIIASWEEFYFLF